MLVGCVPGDLVEAPSINVTCILLGRCCPYVVLTVLSFSSFLLVLVGLQLSFFRGSLFDSEMYTYIGCIVVFCTNIHVDITSIRYHVMSVLNECSAFHLLYDFVVLWILLTAHDLSGGKSAVLVSLLHFASNHTFAHPFLCQQMNFCYVQKQCPFVIVYLLINNLVFKGKIPKVKQTKMRRHKRCILQHKKKHSWKCMQSPK